MTLDSYRSEAEKEAAERYKANEASHRHTEAQILLLICDRKKHDPNFRGVSAQEVRRMFRWKYGYEPAEIQNKLRRLRSEGKIRYECVDGSRYKLAFPAEATT